MSDATRLRLVALLFLLAAFAVYAPAVEGGFVWDDDHYVTANPTLWSVDGLARIWLEPTSIPQYYPLVHTTYWIERNLLGFGNEAKGYHAVNVLLHVVAALLAWRLLARLAVPGAFLAACLFLLHPVHVESVAWITERKNVLSAALALGAALVWLRAHPPDEAPRPPAGRRSLLDVAALALFTGGLLAKTVVCSLPAVLLVVVWWKRGRLRGRDVLATLPMFAVGAALALVTVRLEAEHVGAQSALTPLDRVALAGRVPWFYAFKLVWPADLSFVYPRWEIDGSRAWQLAFPAATLGVLVALWAARGRLGRGPLAATLVFVGVLTPALGFFDVFPFRYSYVADHFQYHASLGLLALLAAGVVAGLRRLRAPPEGVGVATLALAAALGVLSHERARAFTGTLALWQDTLEHNPDSWLAHNNLALELLARGRAREALHHLDEALRLRPDDAGTLVNRGNALEAVGDADAAEEHYRRALEHDPDAATAHNSLGRLRASEGGFEQAVGHFRAGIASLSAERVYKPHDRAVLASLHNNLGLALARSGRVDEAIPEFERALVLDPTNADVRANLAYARQQ